jgi:hypothetical protein
MPGGNIYWMWYVVFVLSIFVIFQGFYILIKGRPLRSWSIYRKYLEREKHPIFYWFYILINIVVGLVFLLSFLFVFFSPSSPSVQSTMENVLTKGFVIRNHADYTINVSYLFQKSNDSDFNPNNLSYGGNESMWNIYIPPGAYEKFLYVSGPGGPYNFTTLTIKVKYLNSSIADNITYNTQDYCESCLLYENNYYNVTGSYNTEYPFIKIEKAIIS